MKTKESKVAFLVTLLFVLASAVAVYYFSGKDAALKALGLEKVKSEKMLSEKLALNKEVDQLKKDINSLKGRNTDLDKKLAGMEATLSKKESEIFAMNKQVQSQQNYKKQAAELQALKDQLYNELIAAKEQLAKVQSENSSLKNTLASLRSENEELVATNYMMNQVLTENYGVEAHRKKERLTVNARKTKEIILGLDVPMEMTEKLSFSIVGPDGKTTASNNSKSITYTVKEDFEFSDNSTLVSLHSQATSTSAKKHVQLSYKPEEKLAKGVYKINVYSDNTYVGSSQIRLK